MKWIDHYESQIAINSVSYHGVNDHSNKEQANRLKRGQTWVTKPLFILVLYPINFSESNTQRRSKTKAIRSNVWQLTGNCPTPPPPPELPIYFISVHLPASVNLCNNEKKISTDYPHPNTKESRRLAQIYFIVFVDMISFSVQLINFTLCLRWFFENDITVLKKSDILRSTESEKSFETGKYS